MWCGCGTLTLVLIETRRTGRFPDHLFIGVFKMAKSIKAAAPATVAATRDAQVGSLIGDAGKAAATMLQKCKEAAAIAAAQLDRETYRGAY